MDDKEFEEVKNEFYDQDWYTFDEFIKYVKAVIGDAADGLAKSMRGHKKVRAGHKIPKEYLVCALATALDATHQEDPEILNNKRWVLCRMKHYDKRV